MRLPVSVQLNARAVGADAHAPAGDRVRQGGAGIAEDLPVVVVAALKLQRLVVRADVLPDGLLGPEIERRALNALEPARRHEMVIHLDV